MVNNLKQTGLHASWPGAKELSRRVAGIWAGAGTLMACLCLLAGCANSRLPGGIPAFTGGSEVSGQWEPDVDYEHERQAQAAQDAKKKSK